MQVDAQHWHNKYYSIALELAAEVNVSESKRRTCKKQTLRENPTFSSISDYYYKTVTKTLLDHLYTQMQAKFDTSSMIPYEGLSVIPSKVIQSRFSCSGFDWSVGFKRFVEFYEDDFPYIAAIEGEMHAWESFWSTYDKPFPTNIS